MEDGFLLEGPRSGRIDPPRRQIRKQGGDRTEILTVIRPKIHPGALPHPTGQGGEERRLHQAVLVVAFFRPRVRKQDPEFGEGDSGRQRVDRFPRFGLHEMTVAELGTLRLALRAADPVADQVDSEIQALRKLRGVAGQEMPVTRTDFEDDGRIRGNERGQRGTQPGLALLNSGEKLGFGSHGSF